MIWEKPFEPISEETLKKALDVMKQCKKVICPLSDFGTVNIKNKVLLETAEKMKILEKIR